MSSILLIEPDKRLAGVYCAALERTGHEVRVVHRAQDAISAADGHAPEIVIMELQLVAHSGIEFLYEFRSYEEWQRIPVVLLTLVPPQALRLDRDIMQRFGIVECLYKPATTLQQLCRAVADLHVGSGATG